MTPLPDGLADAYGRARLYRVGLVVFVAASISGGLAVGPGLLIASRVVQGIGAALLALIAGLGVELVDEVGPVRRTDDPRPGGSCRCTPALHRSR